MPFSPEKNRFREIAGLLSRFIFKYHRSIVPVERDPAWLSLQGARQFGLRRHQHPTHVISLEYFTPTRQQTDGFLILAGQLLSIEIGLAIDKDALLRPYPVKQVAAPGEIVKACPRNGMRFHPIHCINRKNL